ncbi:MAG TPA: efflux RND transporter permease subunit, partial [Rhodospirillales bacterium]|nr:efflux RND transporter permease subunit [Rhodospirillales bacterium]
MSLVRLALERPIAVLAAVALVVLMGWVALRTIPIQLAPDVRRPVITVRTDWPGAAPEEVEREIVIRQEDALKGLEGVQRLTSTAYDGRAEVSLEFRIGTDMNRALLLVSNRLDQVGGYPEEADEPRLSTAGNEDNAIAWFIVTREPDNGRPIHEFGDFLEDTVKTRLERVRGVGQVNLFGGGERELRVIVSPERLALYRLTVGDVSRALREANIALTAGAVEEGKRRYVVRVEGDLATPEEVAAVLLRSVVDATTGRIARIRIGDIATVQYGHRRPVARIRFLGEPALALNATRETGANVIETMAGIREAVAELQAGPLPAAGLRLRQVYDETVYIDSAIDLVVQNIYVGGTLAALVLYLFLRSVAATAVIVLSIPVSVVATFVVMAFTGRSLNVVSLAGIAFAVGMVVDAAIVVLENIYRLRQTGRPPFEAALEGARQVWAPILVSALTTVLVFVPILVMPLEV